MNKFVESFKNDEFKKQKIVKYVNIKNIHYKINNKK